MKLHLLFLIKQIKMAETSKALQLSFEQLKRRRKLINQVLRRCCNQTFAAKILSYLRLRSELPLVLKNYCVLPVGGCVQCCLFSNLGMPLKVVQLSHPPKTEVGQGIGSPEKLALLFTLFYFIIFFPHYHVFSFKWKKHFPFRCITHSYPLQHIAFLGLFRHGNNMMTLP